MNSFVIPYMA